MLIGFGRTGRRLEMAGCGGCGGVDEQRLAEVRRYPGPIWIAFKVSGSQLSISVQRASTGWLQRVHGLTGSRFSFTYIEL